MIGTLPPSPCAPRSSADNKPTRVAIRGIAGLLGSRLAMAISKNPDMELTVGIAKSDRTLTEALRTMAPLSENIRQGALAKQMFLDNKHKEVSKINSSQNIVEFREADQLNLSKECDVIVDATSPGGSIFWMERYASSGLPVILQSGEYPRGDLIAPPIVKQSINGKIFRQGDCVLSGLVPVLAHLEPLSAKLTMHILTQYTEKLNDYTTDERLGAVYIRDDVREEVRNGFSMLFPEARIELVGVSQASGLSYYTANVLLEAKYPISGVDLGELLSGKPRMRVVPSVESTYEISHFHKERAQAFGGQLPPITVFGTDLLSRDKQTLFRIGVAIDYRFIAILPNIDAIRILAKGIDGEASMRITDKNMGFY